MNAPSADHGFGTTLERARTKVARLLRNLTRRGPDERQVSIEDTDQNATDRASRVQTASDTDDRAAISPADEGGEG